jgi:hypothetical protein
MLCAGSLADWCTTTPSQWEQRIQLVARTASQGGALFATITPNELPVVGSSPIDDGLQTSAIRGNLEKACLGARYGERVVVMADAGVTVIVDLEIDGRQRIANAAHRLAGAQVSEKKLSSAISAPATSDPDLVVILGKPTVVPRALTWELAYAEIVFLDISWSALESEHLEMAIDDFTRRDRRFGGVDS